MNFGNFKPCDVYQDAQEERYVFHFKNNYGGRVIRGPHSYGGSEGFFEMAVLKRNRLYRRYWDITYDTPLTKDVRGWLSAEEVVKLLTEISSWKK